MTMTYEKALEIARKLDAEKLLTRGVKNGKSIDSVVIRTAQMIWEASHQ